MSTNWQHELQSSSQGYLRVLPVEIVRIILEWAATSSCMGAVLCRVSKLVFGWTVPISYHTVTLVDPQDTLSFEAALASPPNRGNEYRSAVKCISLPRHGVPPDFSKCPYLRHMAFYAYDHFARVFTSLDRPLLTHLVIYDQSAYFHLRAPFSTRLTHLVVSQQFMLRNLNISDFDFPNLTHFITPVLTNGGNTCTNAYHASFSQLLNLPNIKVVGVMAYRVEFPFRQTLVEENPDRLSILKLVGVDASEENRVVIFPREFMDNGKSWMNVCHGQEDIWHKAERLLLEQRMLCSP